MKTTKIEGREFVRKKVTAFVEVTHFVEVKCSMKSDITKVIWGKRRCFICGGKFKDGDTPVACITKKGKNKIICQKCYKMIEHENK